MKKLILLFCLLLLTSSTTISQLVTQEWVARYQQASQDRVHPSAMEIDSEGNVIIAGWEYLPDRTRIVTLKYSSNGNLIWKRIMLDYPNVYSDPWDLVIDDTNNIYIIGNSSLPAYPLIIKFDPRGNLKWMITDSVGSGRLCKINNARELVITGAGYHVIKYSLDGEFISYASNDSLQGNVLGMDIDSDDNIYATGFGLNSSQGYINVKYNSKGQLLWKKIVHSTSGSGGNAITFNHSTKIVSSTGSSLFAYPQYTVVSYDTSGSQEWLYNSRLGMGRAINSSENKVNNTGHFVELNPFHWAYGTMQFRGSDGTLNWSQTYSGDYWQNTSYDMDCDESDNIYITGGSRKTGGGSAIVTIKYSDAGEQEWLMSYQFAPQTDNEGQFIRTDRNGNVYVCGYGETVPNNFGRYDIILIKYSKPTGINPNSNEIPADYILHQNYPNPFNSKTKISYDIKKSAKVKVEVFNSLGKKIETLLDELKSPGYYEKTFDATGLSSGVYFYSMSIDGITVDRKKMILTK